MNDGIVYFKVKCWESEVLQNRLMYHSWSICLVDRKGIYILKQVIVVYEVRCTASYSAVQSMKSKNADRLMALYGQHLTSKRVKRGNGVKHQSKYRAWPYLEVLKSQPGYRMTDQTRWLLEAELWRSHVIISNRKQVECRDARYDRKCQQQASLRPSFLGDHVLSGGWPRRQDLVFCV